MCYNVKYTERELIKQVISVHRKQFATGLFWQPVSVGVTPSNYARQLAKNSEKKYTLFAEYKSMVGLGDTHDGARLGMPSAAAEIVDSLSEFVSFLGVFKIGSYYYLVAVRNGIIIRDILLETELEARNLYAELSNIPDWGALFAPQSWGMPKSQEKSLSEVIGFGAVAKLRQISLFKALLPSAFFIILFIIGVVYLLRSPILENITPKRTAQLNPELAQEYKRQIELKNAELDKEYNIVKNEVKPIEYPYNYLPDVMERAKLCYKAMGFVMQPIVGWNQTFVKCDENYVSATFVRDFGTLNDFYTIGGDLMPGAIVQQMSENEIIVRAKLPQLPTYASLEERDQVTAMRDIASFFQQVNIKANINGVNDTLTNGVETDVVNVIEVGASSKLIPSEFMHAFNGFDGVYMSAVSWNAKTRTWNYEVVIYTK